MAPTLYDLHKDAFDRLANDGKKSIAKMAKHFTKCRHMDKALGLNNCVHHWVRGNGASNRSEALARHWLAQSTATATATATAKDAATAIPKPATQNPDSVMAIIACNRATFSKLQKLAPILGFEVIDV